MMAARRILKLESIVLPDEEFQTCALRRYKISLLPILSGTVSRISLLNVLRAFLLIVVTLILRDRLI